MITIKFKADNFNLKFDLPIENIAELVRKDIEQNLKTPRSFDDSTLTPLTEDYAKLKLRKLGHKRIFDGFRKGKDKLMNSIMKEKVNETHWIVFVGNDNNDIMSYLQKGVRPMAGARRGFGVSKKSVSRMNKILKDKTKISFV